MSLTIPDKPHHFVVTNESEKNTGWHDGSTCYVTATNKYYILTNGSFEPIGGDGEYLKLDQTTPQTVINDAPYFAEAIKIMKDKKLIFDAE